MCALCASCTRGVQHQARTEQRHVFSVLARACFHTRPPKSNVLRIRAPGPRCCAILRRTCDPVAHRTPARATQTVQAQLEATAIGELRCGEATRRAARPRLVKWTPRHAVARARARERERERCSHGCNRLSSYDRPCNPVALTRHPRRRAKRAAPFALPSATHRAYIMSQRVGELLSTASDR
jgi:hypothetical protein